MPEGSQSDEFGSLLRARRARPDYVNYAKTAKKVDVKKLKDNLWTKLDIPEVLFPPSPLPQTGVLIVRRGKRKLNRGSLRRLFRDWILFIRRRHWRILVPVSVSFVFCILRMRKG